MKSLSLLASLLFAPWAALHAADKPNIIFILADDYGIPGVGCYGGEYKTPHLDALAAGGVRFEHCFAAPLCAPSRALCMFGRYAFRTGVVSNGTGDAATPTKEVCIAKTLKQAGYATAFAGKWSQLSYLNTAEEGRAWGWDEFLRWEKSTGSRYWGPSLNKSGETVKVTETDYGPDMFHEFIVDFMKRQKDKPFFVYYPTTLIHSPLLPTPNSATSAKDVKKEKKNKDGNRYAENVAYLDKTVGKLVAALDELKLRENTLVVFAGDNGSVPVGTINGRKVDGHKSQVNEGGSRVPLIANWKGTTPAGVVLKDLVGLSDFYATFSEVAGAKLPEGVTLDSRSFAPQLRGATGSPREWTYVQLNSNWYVRSDRWKLTERGELFDMSDAPFVQKLVAMENQTAEAEMAREQLQLVLDELKPGEGSAKTSKKVKNKPEKIKKKGKKKQTA